jgi:hypothetical protein
MTTVFFVCFGCFVFLAEAIATTRDPSEGLDDRERDLTLQLVLPVQVTGTLTVVPLTVGCSTEALASGVCPSSGSTSSRPTRGGCGGRRGDDGTGRDALVDVARVAEGRPTAVGLVPSSDPIGYRRSTSAVLAAVSVLDLVEAETEEPATRGLKTSRALPISFGHVEENRQRSRRSEAIRRPIAARGEFGRVTRAVNFPTRGPVQRSTK